MATQNVNWNLKLRNQKRSFLILFRSLLSYFLFYYSFTIHKPMFIMFYELQKEISGKKFKMSVFNSRILTISFGFSLHIVSRSVCSLTTTSPNFETWKAIESFVHYVFLNNTINFWNLVEKIFSNSHRQNSLLYFMDCFFYDTQCTCLKLT